MKRLYEISFIRENIKKPFRQITHSHGKNLDEAIERFKKLNPCTKIFTDQCYQCAIKEM